MIPSEGPQMMISAIKGRAARFSGFVAAGLAGAGTLVATAAAAPLTAADVDKILDAVVGIATEVPADARSAESLGRERIGTGVAIDGNGLVLTIGYLLLEASAASVFGPDGRAVPANVVAYDHETGFGLLRTVLPLEVSPIALGRSGDLKTGDTVLALGRTGSSPLVPQKVVDRRAFAGYWEYLIDDAIFTAPPIPGFGGAALIGADGKLLGIGSLFVGDAGPGSLPVPGNMFVPIDLLKPILADLLADGRRTGPAQPWLGLYTGEAAGRVFVQRVVAGGPAEAAGVKPGDIIMGVGGQSVAGLIDFMRKVRAQGGAGIDVPVDVLSADAADAKIARRVIHSRDRLDWMKKKSGF